MLVIDAHCHAFAPEQVAGRAELAARDATFAELYGPPNARMATAGRAWRRMVEDRIDGVVLAGFAFSDPEDIARQNAALLEAARTQPGMLALATVNPAAAGWYAEARAAVDRGAAGFGELRPANQGWDPLGVQAKRLYRLAEDAGLPLLWHVSEPVGHAYAGKTGGIAPSALAAVAQQQPGLRQIAAHLGGGLPFFLLMPEVRTALANVWFDTAAASLLYHSDTISRVLDLTGPERVLFGSDYPLLSPRRQLERAISGLSCDRAAAVAGSNAQYLFRGLSPS